MTGHDIVVVGASAGGVEALDSLFQRLPAKIPAAFFVVLHISNTGPSFLPQILSRCGTLPAIHPRDHDRIRNGTVYVAPPDYHLMLQSDRVRLVRGPRENRHRPAIDPLFRSAALAYGPRVVGVILTGALDDGTLGLRMVKNCGGIAIVQAPQDAFAPGMPESALRYVDVDHCVPLKKMPDLLAKLVKKQAEMASPRRSREEIHFVTKDQAMTPKEFEAQIGPPSSFICPECNGPLWEKVSGELIHYRCFVGHAFSPESLLAEESSALERALWIAAKTLEERASLLRRLADSTEGGTSPRPLSNRGFEDRAQECEDHAALVRSIVKKVVNEQARKKSRSQNPARKRQKVNPRPARRVPSPGALPTA